MISKILFQYVIKVIYNCQKMTIFHNYILIPTPLPKTPPVAHAVDEHVPREVLLHRPLQRSVIRSRQLGIPPIGAGHDRQSRLHVHLHPIHPGRSQVPVHGGMELIGIFADTHARQCGLRPGHGRLNFQDTVGGGGVALGVGEMKWGVDIFL